MCQLLNFWTVSVPMPWEKWSQFALVVTMCWGLEQGQAREAS